MEQMRNQGLMVEAMCAALTGSNHGPEMDSFMPNRLERQGQDEEESACGGWLSFSYAIEDLAVL